MTKVETAFVCTNRPLTFGSSLNSPTPLGIPMFRKTYAEINLDHLQHNLTLLQENFSAETFFVRWLRLMLMVTGTSPWPERLNPWASRPWGFVLSRRVCFCVNSFKADVLVFRGFDLEGARVMLQNQLTPVVSDWHQLEHLDHLVANLRLESVGCI